MNGIFRQFPPIGNLVGTSVIYGLLMRYMGGGNVDQT